MRVRLFALLLLCTTGLGAADITGHWAGSLTLHGPNGTVQTQPVYLVLSQQNGLLTGSGGNDERSQSPIRNGRIADDEISFEIGLVKMHLHLNGAALEGVGSRVGTPEMTATLSVKRVRDVTIGDRLSRLPYEGTDRSPRMLELRAAIPTRGSAAIIDFWESVASSGAPVLRKK